MLPCCLDKSNLRTLHRCKICNRYIGFEGSHIHVPNNIPTTIPTTLSTSLRGTISNTGPQLQALRMNEIRSTTFNQNNPQLFTSSLQNQIIPSAPIQDSQNINNNDKPPSYLEATTSKY